jgi:hypothetical protein
MAPDKFIESVRTNLTDGRVFPPVEGTIGNLRIAATLIDEGAGAYRGVLLLANADPHNNRVVRLKGAVGEFALGTYSSNNGTPWSTEVGLPAQALRSLVDASTYEALTAQAAAPLASQDGEIIALNYNDPGVAPGMIPTINGVPFEDVVHY